MFCDLPTLPAGPVGKFLVTQMAAVAELEAGLISQRTRAALAVAKARGVRLGWDCPAFVDTLKLCPQGVPYAQNPFALCAGIPADLSP